MTDRRWLEKRFSSLFSHSIRFILDEPFFVQWYAFSKIADQGPSCHWSMTTTRNSPRVRCTLGCARDVNFGSSAARVVFTCKHGPSLFGSGGSPVLLQQHYQTDSFLSRCTLREPHRHSCVSFARRRAKRHHSHLTRARATTYAYVCVDRNGSHAAVA